MRILYVPFFSNGNLQGCSIFNSQKVLLRAIVENCPDVFLYYLVPEKDVETNSPALQYLVHPRIMQIPVRAFRFQEDDLVYAPEQIYDLFNIDTGEYPVDLVLCDKHRITPWVSLLVNNKITGVNGNIPVVNVSQFGSGLESDYASHTEEFVYSQVMGWFVGWNMWLAPFQQKLALDVARKFAQPHVVKRIADQSYAGRTSMISSKRLLNRPVDQKSKDEIWFNFPSRLSVQSYNFEPIFEDVEKLYQAGRKVKLIITSPGVAAGGSGREALAGFEKRGMNVEAHFALPQEDFFNLAAKCHVTMQIIGGSGPPLALREQAFMNVACVMPKTAAYVDSFPDYPWQFRTKLERQTMLRYIVDNYWSSDVQKVIQKYHQHLLNNHCVETQWPQVHAFLVQAMSTAVPSTETPIMREVLDAAGWPDTLTMDDMRKIITTHTRAKINWSITYLGTCRHQFIRALRSLGYVDTAETAKPVWKKVAGAAASV